MATDVDAYWQSWGELVPDAAGGARTGARGLREVAAAASELAVAVSDDPSVEASRARRGLLRVDRDAREIADRLEHLAGRIESVRQPGGGR